MDFKFGKDSGDSQHQEAPGEKKKQNLLLVLLLILVGGFTYIYFFTGLIKPQEIQKTAEAPVLAPDAVKMPLPPREGEAVQPGGKAPDETKIPKEAATAPKVAAAPAAVPAKPVPTPKPAPVPAKPQEKQKKVEAAKAAVKKPQPTPAAVGSGEKEAAAKAEEKKSAVAEKKSIPAATGVKKAGLDGQAKHKPIVKTKKTVATSWSLAVGSYVLEEALSADMGRVRKAGFKPVVKPSTRKKTAMNRLFVSEYNDRAAALSILEKLKRYTSDAFVIEQGGKFAVYAGSYLQSEAANTEKERLKGAGFPVVVRHAAIAIPSQSLTVGPFSSKKAAESAHDKLKSAGIISSLSQR